MGYDKRTARKVDAGLVITAVATIKNALGTKSEINTDKSTATFVPSKATEYTIKALRSLITLAGDPSTLYVKFCQREYNGCVSVVALLSLMFHSEESVVFETVKILCDLTDPDLLEGSNIFLPVIISHGLFEIIADVIDRYWNSPPELRQIGDELIHECVRLIENLLELHISRICDSSEMHHLLRLLEYLVSIVRKGLTRWANCRILPGLTELMVMIFQTIALTVEKRFIEWLSTNFILRKLLACVSSLTDEMCDGKSLKTHSHPDSLDIIENILDSLYIVVPKCKERFLELGGVEILIKFSSNFQAPLIGRALRVLESLVDDDEEIECEVVKELVNTGCLDLIVNNVLLTYTPETLEPASSLLRSMLSDSVTGFNMSKPVHEVSDILTYMGVSRLVYRLNEMSGLFETSLILQREKSLEIFDLQSIPGITETYSRKLERGLHTIVNINICIICLLYLNHKDGVIPKCDLAYLLSLSKFETEHSKLGLYATVMEYIGNLDDTTKNRDLGKWLSDGCRLLPKSLLFRRSKKHEFTN